MSSTVNMQEMQLIDDSSDEDEDVLLIYLMLACDERAIRVPPLRWDSPSSSPPHSSVSANSSSNNNNVSGNKRKADTLADVYLRFLVEKQTAKNAYLQEDLERRRKQAKYEEDVRAFDLMEKLNKQMMEYLATLSSLEDDGIAKSDPTYITTERCLKAVLDKLQGLFEKM